MPGSNPRGRSGPFGPAGRVFNSPPIEWAASTRVSGITKDSAGTALGACTVTLYQTTTDLAVREMVSNATTGEYVFHIEPSYGTFYIVAYKAGAPDVAGTTVDTLVAA